MPTTTPNSVSRYRPAVLVLAGVAAAYAAYLVFNISESSPRDTLHRSNAVRRPNARHRQQGSQTERLTALYGDIPAFGDITCHQVQIPLNPHNLILRNELRDVITQQAPELTPEHVDQDIEYVYDIFLDRLLAMVTPNRLPSHTEVETIARWVAERHGDCFPQPSTAVERAVARHALMLESAAVPAVDGAESVAATEVWSDEATEDGTVDPDGQTLQRTLYHIAEDRARHEGVVHRGITCNGCDEKPIRGIRWRCANCSDFDLCSSCEATNSHIKTHVFYKIRIPAPYFGTVKQEPLYPGKPHVMSSSIQSILKKRLLAETKMEAEEIDALWDQFTCIAGTEWLTDPNNIGWALDRRAFDYAFVPRFKNFVAAPNLLYDRIFAYYDSDKNGLIGFEEWIKGIDGMHATNGQVKSRIVFNGYDIDGDGYISRKDVLRIFRAYYALENEATRNYVANITEELMARNALDTINSSQPLGSAFTPHGLAANDGENPQLSEKNPDDFENAGSVLQDDQQDIAERDEMLKTANIHNIGSDQLTQNEQDRIVTDRWARRQFYTDEEEGLERPEGAEDDVVPEDSEDVAVNAHVEDPEDVADQSSARPRWSRSSSRVRFQDDVDIDTRSNASTGSRPFGERWGGYEIPEPEKDLGKEVLYQISQQGFNELLDPLFVDRENNAMDAYATRNERRQFATQLEQITERLKTQERAHLRAICKIGIFRYSKCIVDMFGKTLNASITKLSANEISKGPFHNVEGGSTSHDQARTNLLQIYHQVQDSVLATIDVPEEWTVSDMALWNTWLAQDQLRDEVLAAALDSASILGWIAPTVRQELPVQLTDRDPTMPQFRPNSLVDLLALESSANVSPPRATNGDTSSRFEAPDDCQMKSDPKGPFFACSLPPIESSSVLEQKVTELDASPTTTVLSASSPSVSDAERTPQPPQSQPTANYNGPNWRDYTDNPMFHILHIDTSSGVGQLRYSPKPIIHSSNPFQPEFDQLRPLHRHIRELAMDPTSQSHLILLASLEAVQQEIRERGGSGMISFEEFDEHMQQGKLRFLESWMEWSMVLFTFGVVFMFPDRPPDFTTGDRSFLGFTGTGWTDPDIYVR